VDLVVVGDAMVDVAVDSETLARGGDVPGSVRIRPGGTGANAAAWGAAAGASVRLHARVGDDLPGRLVREALEAAGVEAVLAVDAEAPTGAMLVVREAGERSMVADRGAAGRLSPDDLPETIDAGAVLVSGYLLFDHGTEAAGRAALERARAEHVALDAASWPLLEAYGIDRFLEAARRATLLLANEPEAAVLTGASREEAARALAAPGRMACVKLAGEGAVLASNDLVLAEAAPRAETVDPTGAGDAFDGTLLGALAGGMEVPDALRAACEAGARAVAREGPWP
jgi:sugar/nucleoside kinase (ribokinase family)